MKLDWNKLLSEKRIRNLYEEPDKNRPKDRRTEFERDYDRAIFCTPVRRLHDKAQVFPLERNDSVRTRLAHSLEVSTIARDIGQAVSKWLLREGELQSAEQAEAIPVIAATCGLIHDLGNPPFGHAGEDAIRSWFNDHDDKILDALMDDGFCIEKNQYAQDFLKFEGNAQTIRLISRLQLLADYYGLNLTCATLLGVCKYTVNSLEADKNSKVHEKEKVGYFASEKDLMVKVREEAGIDDKKCPIAFIVEACDDIAYSIVDIEDAVKKNIISWEFLCSELNEKDNSGVFEEAIEKASRIVEKATKIGLTNKEKQITWVEAFRVYAIGKGVDAVIEAFQGYYNDIIQGEYHGELIKDSNVGAFIKACKTVGKNYIYNARSNLTLEIMGRQVIHDLMDFFWEAVLQEKGNPFADKLFSLLSPNYRRVFEYSKKELKLPETYCQMQLVTDYICGMTDTFACNLHKELKNGRDR